MKGRLENENHMNDLINKKIENRPEYMQSYSKTFIRKSYTTKNVYINYVLEFLDYLKNELNLDINDIKIFQTIKPSTINGYLDYLSHIERITSNGIVKKNGDGIQCRKFYAIKNFFKFLVNDEYINKNPCDNVEPPKVDNDANNIIAMDKKEINKMLKNIQNGTGTNRAKSKQLRWRSRDYAIITMGLSLGLRITSVSEINLEDLDLENKTLIVTEKGNRSRVLNLSDNLVETLQNWIDDRREILGDIDCDALFISNQKKRLSVRALRDLIEKYSAGIDKHITPHKLRSTYVTNIYTETGDIYLAANMVGHKNIQNTKRYAMVVDEKKEKAMNIVDKIVFGKKINS